MRDGAEPRYPPLGDYAIVGDCRTTALITRAGAVEWLCLPDFASPSVFAAILDRGRGGSFRLAPSGPASVSRRYLPATPVLETRFETETGTLRLTDAMILPEGGLDPERELLRIAEVERGAVELDIAFAPRPHYGAAAVLQRRGALGWACAHSDSLLLLNSSVPLELGQDGSMAAARVRLEAGMRCVFSLTYVRREVAVIPPLGAAAAARLERTIAWWQDWSEKLCIDGRWRDAVLRSAITLKLLASATTGAVIAAPTTSLPESVGGTRNWDYRYCWLRDASLTVEAFLELGCDEEARRFLEWLLHATRLTQPRLQVLYDMFGNARVPERTLDHLDGYRCSRPVRVGNGAWRQSQLDVYGEVVRAAWLFVEHGGELDAEQARVLAGFARAVRADWRKPDHGIWEIRGEPKPYTHSKVLCWSALDCLARLARKGCVDVDAASLETVAHEIAAAIETGAFDAARGSYASVLGGDAVDAALLVLPHYGFVPAEDARMRGTWARIERELGSGEMLLRYGPGGDGLDGEENPFGICAFWAVDYLARAGRRAEAVDRFERLLARANDVGLYGEEMDRSTGEPLGNYPQAFTHTGLVLAAQAIARAEEA